MESMFLLLDKKFCNSSIHVLYLIMDPFSTHSKIVIPLLLIDFDDEDPY